MTLTWKQIFTSFWSEKWQTVRWLYFKYKSPSNQIEAPFINRPIIMMQIYTILNTALHNSHLYLIHAFEHNEFRKPVQIFILYYKKSFGDWTTHKLTLGNPSTM